MYAGSSNLLLKIIKKGPNVTIHVGNGTKVYESKLLSEDKDGNGEYKGDWHYKIDSYEWEDDISEYEPQYFVVFVIPDYGVDKDPKSDTSFEFEYWTDGEPYPWFQVAFYKTNAKLGVNLSWEAFLAWFFALILLIIVCMIGCCI